MPLPYFDPQTFEKLYPSDLKCRYVAVIHRHGQRTSVYDRPTWYMCHLTPQLHAFYAAKESLDNHPHSPEHPAHETKPKSDRLGELPGILSFSRVILEGNASVNYKPPNYLSQNYLNRLEQINGDGSCLAGQLTDIGKLTLQKMGYALRHLYVDKLGLLPSKLNPDSLYVRSTEFARTIESVQYLLNGLYPLQYRENNTDLPVHVKAEENMHPLPTVKKAQDLSKKRREEATKELNPLIQEMSERMNLIGIDIKPRMRDVHILHDYLMCMEGNEVAMPSGITDKDLQDLETICVRNWWNTYATDKELARLTIGRFLNDIKTSIQQGLKGGSKMNIYSGHDSTLAPLLGALEVYDNRFPSFASVVNIEVFEDMGAPFWKRILSSPLYVRVNYNGSPTTLPFCRKVGNHKPGNPQLCTLDAFYKCIDELSPSEEELGPRVEIESK